MADTRIKAGQFYGVIGHGTDGYFLMTNADGSMSWSQASTGPSVTSVAYPGDDTAADPAGGQTVVLTGTGFATSGMTVSIGGTTAPSVAHDSNTQLTITTPAKAAGDYDIVVTNTVTGASGTFVNGISYNGIPTWTTPAGSLGTFDSETTIDTITLQATEPDGGTITFNITNGALPSGLSLTGANIDGTTTAESSTTLYSFTIEAIDDENQSTPRNFSITVNAAAITNYENFTVNTYTGNGSTQSIEGKIGTAASFNGSSSRININDDGIGASGTTRETFSVSLWVKVISATQSGIISDYISPNFGFAIQLETTGRLSLWNQYTGSNITSVGTTNINDNNWHHLLMINNTSDNTQKLYIDNTLEIDQTLGTGTKTSSNIQVGYYNINGTPNYFFNGKIDQVRIFNRALSTDNNGVNEITTLYGENNASSTKSTTDIFDDGSGIALYEFEEGAKDTGGVNGYIGSAAIFNGSSSKISLGDFFDFSTESFSISCWVNTASLSSSQCVFSQWSSTSTNRALLAIIDTSGNFSVLEGFGSTNNGGTRPISTTTISTNTWVHLVYTRSGTEGTIFVNGVEEDRNTLTNTINNSTEAFQLGMQESSSKPFNGKIDQVRIFNTELNPTQVAQLAAETSATASTTDIFDDGSGVALYELEGDANDSGDFKQVTMAPASATSGGYVDTAAISGKYYWEVLYSDRESLSNTLMVGVGSDTSAFWTSASNYFYYSGNGDKYTNSTQQSYSGVTYTEGDIIGVALDLDGDTVTFYKNGVSQGQAFTGLNAVGGYYAMVSTGYNAESAIFYFDSNDWTYSAPSGYSQWDDAINASIVTLNGATLDTYDGTATNVSYGYDGTPTNVSFVGTSFQPDLVWLKNRDTTEHNILIDVIRQNDYGKFLSSNLTIPPFNTTQPTFDSNGFTLDGVYNGYLNIANNNYVAWCWKAGGTAVSNTDGSITSSVSANPDAGFSIVKFTGDGTNATIGHGLSEPPEMIIVKPLDSQSGPDWKVYHSALGNLKVIYLNLTVTPDTVPSDFWGTISSDVFGQGGATIGYLNILNNDYIAYCFHSIDGYQKIGSYTGTGSAGNIVTTGFEPRFVMIKRTNTTGNWNIWDSIRNPSADNDNNNILYPNKSDAETDAGSGRYISFDVDGFTISGDSGDQNASGSTYIYLAIA
jgi:hypothetical protein